jgi:AcrR family transcriptional regulator
MSTNRRSRRTRTEILDAAWELISKQGAEVSLTDIASIAGVSRQALYLHFGTRGGLLTEMVRRADERFGIEESFDHALRLPQPVSRLNAMLNAWLDFVENIYPVARELIRLKATDPDADTAWSDRMDALKSAFTRLMVMMEDDGLLHPRWEPEPAADFLWTMVSVQVWGLLTTDCKWSPEEARDVLRDRTRESLLRPQ